MNYSRPPFPRPLYTRFRSLASALGWGVRGQCWKFLDVVLSYVEAHPDLFRNRMSKKQRPPGSLSDRAIRKSIDDAAAESLKRLADHRSS